MPSYKLTYFNARGLGEGARLLFHYADVPFEDVRIEREQWGDLKPSKAFPLLQLGNKLLLCSLFYSTSQKNKPHKCFKRVRLVSYHYWKLMVSKLRRVPLSTNFSENSLVWFQNVRLKKQSLYDAHKDFITEIKPLFLVIAGFKEGNKSFEIFLEKSQGNYLLGKDITWADIVIADSLANFEGFASDTFEKFSEIKNFMDRVRSLPKIKKWIAERPITKF